MVAQEQQKQEVKAKYRFRCPSCGNLDASQAQISVDTWYALKVDTTYGYIDTGESYGTAEGTQGDVFCQVCEATCPAENCIEEIED